MITAREAFALPKAVYTPSDEVQVEKLCRLFDGAVRENFDGTGVTVEISKDDYAPKIVDEFFRRIRRAGWAAQVQARGEMSKLTRETVLVGWAAIITPRDENARESRLKTTALNLARVAREVHERHYRGEDLQKAVEALEAVLVWEV